MALIELEQEFTKYLEPLKQTVEDRFDEFSAPVKETTLSLSKWDAETEESVVALHKARDEQVRSSKGLSPCGCKRHFSIIIIALYFIARVLFYIWESHFTELQWIATSVFVGARPVFISFSQAGADLEQLKVRALLNVLSRFNEELNSKTSNLNELMAET